MLRGVVPCGGSFLVLRSEVMNMAPAAGLAVRGRLPMVRVVPAVLNWWPCNLVVVNKFQSRPR